MSQARWFALLPFCLRTFRLMKKIPFVATALFFFTGLAPAVMSAADPVTEKPAEKSEGKKSSGKGGNLGPKARIFAKYDTNKNGVIDGDEVAAVRAAFAADPKG